jgi:hypothetical protein
LRALPQVPLADGLSLLLLLALDQQPWRFEKAVPRRPPARCVRRATPLPSLGTLRTMGKLVRRTLDGDQPLAECSASDSSSYDTAVAVFERELRGGYAAVRADGGPRHEAVTELPRDAELVILATAMGGG